LKQKNNQKNVQVIVRPEEMSVFLNEKKILNNLERVAEKSNPPTLQSLFTHFRSFFGRLVDFLFMFFSTDLKFFFSHAEMIKK